MSRPDGRKVSDAERAQAIEDAEAFIAMLEDSLGALEEYAQKLERGEE